MKLLIANWKMNPRSLTEALKLARASDKKGVVICPPFVFLEEVGKALKHAALGAQDVFAEDKGAFTGEVSPKMLKNLGVKYVIIGHSEKRKTGDTDALINKKVKAALRAGLKVILCVGEGKEVRRRGVSAAKNFVKRQLQKDLAGAISYKPKTKSLFVAYEPIWAISTEKGARADTPESAAQMSRFIKNLLKAISYKLKADVLYGGSVTSRNVSRFLRRPEFSGALVGGASLKAGEFRQIITKTSHNK
ncbi:MAG: triose-phosphate isomerase [Patescibacteria group bacterium]